MSDTKPETISKAAKQSSPRYPFISLTKALERAQEFRRAAGANAAVATDARKAWGYGEKSSGGDQTIAALSYYGLLEDVGVGPTRRLKLTDAANRYFREERPEMRAELLARFALTPKAMTKLWEMWKHTPPSDAVARSILKLDLKYSDWAADELLKVYRENLQYIPDRTSDYLPSKAKVDGQLEGEGDEKQSPAQVKVGDYVQWTSGGADQFPIPARVKAIADDGSHLFVHGSATGVPIAEVRVVDAPSALPKTAIPQQSVVIGGEATQLSVLMRGNRLEISADVDREGLTRLKEILTKYEAILDLMNPPKPTN